MATDRVDPFSSTAQDELAAAYKKAGSVRPYTKADITKALAPYNLGAASKRKGKTDVQLEQIAAAAVVAKFKKGLLKPKAQAKAATTPTAPARVVAATTRTSVPAPTALTPAQIAARLKAFGVPHYWNPPPAARTSQAALDAWIRRAIAYRAAHKPATPAPVSSPRKQATAAPKPIATNRAPIPL